MKEMLAEYEQNIAEIKSILKQLRANNSNGQNDFKIGQYEQILSELRHSAGSIKKYLE